MSIARGFLVIGSLYLIAGMFLGMYMGASGEHKLAPVHAHINLVGFTLMTMFGLAYKVIPALAESHLARAHFWLYQTGAVLFLGLLFMMLSGLAAETTVGPAMPVAELALLVGVGLFAFNLYRTVR